MNGVEPPTRKMIEENTWGIYVKQLDKNKIHRIVEDELSIPVSDLPNVAAGNRHEDQAGITGLPWISCTGKGLLNY